MEKAFHHEVDVLVAGGGIAGTLAALAFCHAGFSTSLLDDGPPGIPGDEYRQRVSSFNLASEQALRKLGVWPLIARHRISPIERIEVRDNASSPLVFDAATVGLPHLAHILENDLVSGATREVLESNPMFQQVGAGRATDIERNPDGLIVVAADGSRIRCQLLIGADGADSMVRRFAGIGRDTFDYRQRAIVTRVFLNGAHHRIARQRFLPTGPLAFLPLADNSCSIVWSMEEGMAGEILSLDDGPFCERLERAFDIEPGYIHGVEPRTTFPLRRTHATRYTADRMALIGDACHTVHPLAGLGANQGIADAMALVDTVDQARARGQRFWHDRVLARYQRSRRPQNSIILATMDLFHLGFANDLRWLPEIRDAVFSLVDHAPVIKRFFITQATGRMP
jgi:2-polyprenylphenol 6-hydroxylase